MIEPVRILIADDHPEFRAGLEALLRTAPHVITVGVAATGAEAVALARDLQPDLVLMDLQMPDVNGIEATRRIVTTSPHIRVLVLTMFDDDDSVFAAVRAGARGYLLKGAGREELLRAVRAVTSGEAIFGPRIAQHIVNYFSANEPRSAEPFPELSDREREVLTLIAKGRSNSEINRQLCLSPSTVRNYITNIFSKLQVADRAQAIVAAREAGIGSRPGPRWDDR
ncbi:MAG: response regulator [Pseudonocardiaceae bacterium]